MALSFLILFWNPLKKTLTEAFRSEWFTWEAVCRSLSRAVGDEGLLGDSVLQGHLLLERGDRSGSPPSLVGF